VLPDNVIPVEADLAGFAVFPGANQDAVEVAKDLSIANALNYDASPTGMMELRFSVNRAHRKMSKLAHEDADLSCCACLFEDNMDA